MKTKSVTASNKTPMTIRSSKALLLSKSLYTRTGLTHPEWRLVETWQVEPFLFPTTTDIRPNHYGLIVAYIPDSITLKMSDPETGAIFEIKKFGDQVTYTSMNSQGSVATYFEWDILVSVALIVGGQSQSSHNNKNQFNEENGIQHLIAVGEEQGSIFSNGKESVIVPNTTYFSFTTNTSLYFSAGENQASSIHQVINEKLVKVESRILQGYASSGGSYALTDNKDKLYPDGISILNIDDGFSESVAKIEFNHNTTDGTVKISVLSKTVRVCELRESMIVFAL
ncbi:hypothetical protein SAMN03159382_04734 [Pseudomonas sp. NFACC23-1]|uniref:hypothetical protein n=1 Tax=unclassified Pseudomonas TaxID=196821 RepID=UPI00088F23DC|nr:MULTISPECIES: hypothetical protein [unclassified Pseudomonas]SDB60102.1 hypothetical protein SAMN03159386_04754 [Pseudomonas sp. NFACC17-2]SEJ84508.1 hypothetical protein SAMN03159382_04734 [Pseudomonas sp. NFACC23-1]SFW91455.1 hypothetical protein SAMN05660640_05166 [Pseudomonas sp. NFACC16-2]